MKKIIVLAVVCSIFFSCKKEGRPDVPYVQVSDEVFSYINLAQNSWYIYRDSASGIIDSVQVTISFITYKAPRNILNPLTGGQYHQCYIDDYYLTLEKVDLSGNRTTWIDARTFAYFDINPQFWVLQDLTTSAILMRNPSSNISGLPSVYKITSAVVEGVSYADIQVVASGSDVVWWAKGTGIVKLSRLVNGNIQTSLLLRKK